MEDKKQQYVINKLTTNLIEKINTMGAEGIPFMVNHKVEGGFLKTPVNYITKYAYKGINKLTLPIGEYVSLKQLTQVADGIKQNAVQYTVSKSFVSTLVKFEYTDKETNERKQKVILKKMYHPERYIDPKIVETIYSVKYAYDTLYNINDLINVKPSSKPYPDYVLRKNAASWCEENDDNSGKIKLTNIYINKYLKYTGLDQRAYYDDYNSYYAPKEDTVYFKNKSTFDSNCRYYEQVFHELAHSTGHQTRLNRKMNGTTANFSQTDYNAEEIIAELASMYCLETRGLLTYGQVDRCLAYIRNYFQSPAFKKGLKENPKLLLQSVSNAYRASDYLLGGYQKGESDDTSDTSE